MCCWNRCGALSLAESARPGTYQKSCHREKTGSAPTKKARLPRPFSTTSCCWRANPFARSRPCENSVSAIARRRESRYEQSLVCDISPAQHRLQKYLARQMEMLVNVEELRHPFGEVLRTGRYRTCNTSSLTWRIRWQSWSRWPAWPRRKRSKHRSRAGRLFARSQETPSHGASGVLGPTLCMFGSPPKRHRALAALARR